MRHKLHKTSVDKNTSGDGIENTIRQQRSPALRRKRLAHAQTNSNGNRGRDAVAETKEVRGPALGRGPGDFSETGTQTEAFEHLVEDEDDVEGDEFLAGYGKGEADEDGVEDDTEFEDEDGG